QETKKNDDDDIPIIDHVYDLKDEESVKTVFEKLIKNAYNIGDKNKNSCQKYIRNSVRTRQRKLQKN
ncbi:567_t:CDS:1, partial [Racocetra fulgida]